MQPSIAIAATDAQHESTDLDLAAAAREDPRAFGALFQRHRDAVYRFLRARGAADDDAAELTAVTFERAFMAVSRYRESSAGGPLSWLLRIARNAAIDESRRRRRTTPLDDLPLAAHADDPAGPEAGLLESEALERVRALVRALPEPQRDAVILRYATRLPAREIAMVIGKSPAATEKLLVRALATLREAYRVD